MKFRNKRCSSKMETFVCTFIFIVYFHKRGPTNAAIFYKLSCAVSIFFSVDIFLVIAAGARLCWVVGCFVPNTRVGDQPLLD